MERAQGHVHDRGHGRLCELNDPRCKVAGANYSVMCGPYQWNTISTNICFLLCKFNNTSYDCPPAHTCKTLSNGYNVCLPQ